MEPKAEAPSLLTDCPQTSQTAPFRLGVCLLLGQHRVSGTGTRGVPQHPKSKGHPKWDAVLLCRDSLEQGQCPAVAAQGSWTGLPPRMPGMRSGCVLPAPLPPPTPRTGYSLSREAQVQPPYGKTSGYVLGTAPALGWDPVGGNLGL